MKFLNYKLTLVAVLAIFLASCAGDGNKEKDKEQKPAETILKVGDVFSTLEWANPTTERTMMNANNRNLLEIKSNNKLLFKFSNLCLEEGTYKLMTLDDFRYTAEFEYTLANSEITLVGNPNIIYFFGNNVCKKEGKAMTDLNKWETIFTTGSTRKLKLTNENKTIKVNLGESTNQFGLKGELDFNKVEK